MFPSCLPITVFARRPTIAGIARMINEIRSISDIDDMPMPIEIHRIGGIEVRRRAIHS